MWPVIVDCESKYRPYRKAEMLTSAQGFINNQAANTTSGSKQQDMHRIRGQSVTMVSCEIRVQDRKPGI